MSIIHRSLLQSLTPVLDPHLIANMESRLERESRSPSHHKQRLSTSASLISKHRHTTTNLERGSSKYSGKQSQLGKQPYLTPQTLVSIRSRNSKAVYYQTKDLPSLHSMDAVSNSCVKHSRAKRGINEVLESSDLLNIEQLQVFYCQIDSLRLFGTGWKVKSLSVVGCRLKDLSGINGFLHIESLFASYNRIEALSDIAFNQTLKVLDLQGNLLRDIEQIEYLLTVDRLEMINLDYNPIMESKRNDVVDLLGQRLDAEHYQIDGVNLQTAQQDFMDLQKFENVLLIDHLNNQLHSKQPYDEIIEAIKKDKYADYTQKQLNLDGRFQTEVEEDHQKYLLDDLMMFYNPKKALEKDSMTKYLILKFALPEQSNESSSSKARPLMRRSSTKKGLAIEEEDRKDYSLLSSKISLKNEQDVGSARGSTTISGSATFTDTILSRPESHKRRFVLRKTSLKKDKSTIEVLQSPTSSNKQMFSKTAGIVNK